MAPHTHLVLDETQLSAGKLEQTGVEAVASIARLIRTQKLKCNFQYYELEFDANVPVLCLSEGRSMLPLDCHLPLCIQDESAAAVIRETLAAAKHFLQPKLTAIRKWLTKMKLTEFEIGSDTMEMIQNDFVEMRSKDSKFSGEDLNMLLVLSRLLGLSNGRRSLAADIWQQAKQLEEERKRRIAAAAAAATQNIK